MTSHSDDFLKVSTIDDFEKLSEAQKYEFKNNSPARYEKLFLDAGMVIHEHLGMSHAMMCSPENTTRAALSAGYSNMAETGKSGFDYSKHTAELNFLPSDIKTPNDFEKLSEVGKMYLKDKCPEQYNRIWRQ